jgi:spoIIIJ-associated protein
MSQYLEFIGKNVDSALSAAAERLNKPVEQIRYEVASYGSSGIFGLVGTKKAKIRVKVGDAFGVDSDTKAQARDLVSDAFKTKEDPSPEQRVKKEIAQVKDKPLSEKRDTQEPCAESIEKAIVVGKEAVQRMVDFLTSDTVLTVDVSSQRLIFKVEGGNSGLLIGKRGQTLEAIQYLAEKIVNKQVEERVRVLVDVEGYLDTRRANLEKLATSMAEKAQKTQKPVTIGQMNAYDRRTVHVHLKSNTEVRTQSVGEGYYRKLIIFPKKMRRNKPRK